MKPKIKQPQTVALIEQGKEKGYEMEIARSTTGLNKKVVRIGSLDELQGLIDEPMICSFELDGRTIEIPITRMSAATMETVRQLKRKVQPPYSQERKDYDFLNSAYLESKDVAERKARSVAIYKHCPIVAAKKPGLLKVDEIDGFVQGLFSENVLEMLSLKIQLGGIDVDERVNFTSMAG